MSDDETTDDDDESEGRDTVAAIADDGSERKPTSSYEELKAKDNVAIPGGTSAEGIKGIQERAAAGDDIELGAD